MTSHLVSRLWWVVVLAASLGALPANLSAQTKRPNIIVIGGGGKAEPVGNHHGHTRVDAGILRIRSTSNDGHHAVAVQETSGCSANINHLAGDFQTGNDRVAEVRPFSVESLSLENVGAIQPGCADAD